MTIKVNRRKFLAATAAGTATAALGMPAIAQGAPFKIGLLTVKTGPLAQGGIQTRAAIRLEPRPRPRSSSSATRSTSSSGRSPLSSCSPSRTMCATTRLR